MLIDGSETDSVYYMDTHSMYIEEKGFDKLSKAGYVGEQLGQRNI